MFSGIIIFSRRVPPSNEPHRDKTIRPVWSESSLSAWRLWSDWMDAQADLSLRSAHSHFVGFSIRWLKLSRCDFLASLTKGYFSRWRRKRYLLLMAEIAVLMLCVCFFFYIRLHASSRNSMRNRFYIWWWGIILAALCWRSLSQRHHWERRRHFESICGWEWINAMFNCHSNFNLLFKHFNTSGSVNEILAFTQNICCVDVHDA